METILRYIEPDTGLMALAFHAMEVAERVLEARYGGSEPPGAFLALRPRYDVFRGRTSVLEAHMREILDRVDAGEALHPATAAECCCVLAEMAMVAPLRRPWYLAYVRAFVDAVGSAKAIDVLGNPDAIHRDLESYEEDVRAQEALEMLRAKLADPERAR